MIHTELLNNDTLIRHYSDRGVRLIQNETGNKYSDPVDLVPCMYTYTETDEPIGLLDPDYEVKEKATAYDILMGVTE